MNTSVIIPYKEDSPERRRNLLFLIDHLKNLNWEIIVVEMDYLEHMFHPNIKKIFIKSSDMFNKSKCYNEGVKQSKYKQLFLTDSDIILPYHVYQYIPINLQEFDVVDPYKFVYYYAEPETKSIINDPRGFNGFYYKKVISGIISGGCFGINKDVYNMLKGFPEECSGWGYEDSIFDRKIKWYNLKVKKFNEYCIHLNHPVIESYHTNVQKNKDVWKEYMLKRNM